MQSQACHSHARSLAPRAADVCAVLTNFEMVEPRVPQEEVRGVRIWVGAPVGALFHRFAALEKTLSAVYLLALLGVSVSILWLLADAVISVSRKPRWEAQVFRSLKLVTTEDRRKESLPFIGADRRHAPADAPREDVRKVA